MYAIIEQNGHQYKIKPGEEIEIDRIASKEGEQYSNSKVLLLVDNDKVDIGKPYLTSVRVVFKVLSHYKGDKLRVSRFKAKSRYTKVTGFRPFLTKLKVEKIENISGSPKTATSGKKNETKKVLK